MGVVTVRKSHKGRGERKEDAQGIKENGRAGKIMVGQEWIKLFFYAIKKKKISNQKIPPIKLQDLASLTNQEAKFFCIRILSKRVAKIAVYAKTQILASWLVNFGHLIEIPQFNWWNFLITDLMRKLKVNNRNQGKQYQISNMDGHFGHVSRTDQSKTEKFCILILIERADGKNSKICKNTNYRFLIGQFSWRDRNPAIW